METFYLVLIVVLFLLAISDLIVGVSNDAVNFLNSAFGSKAASFRTIIAIAALGVFVGAAFSGGMMEVARKGIFHPQQFYFSEIMIIFLAVMITDVILLDTFNSLGLPTSTTVSIVFELLGAAVAISILKISNDPNALPMNEYINSGKALAIISGILLSVVVAFSSGMIVQFLSRLLFSFDYKSRLKRYGALWGAMAITAITYYILIKGAKTATFMSSDIKDYIKGNTLQIIGISFVAWFIILQVILLLTKFNVMKFIVLMGTFALAMAFSGNDLVNFIGVPLAGYESFQTYMADTSVDPDGLLMSSLAGKVKTPIMFLLLAGLIMVLTLFLSKKAKSVMKTSLDLGRQDDGYERFSSSMASRAIVRGFTRLSYKINAILPDSLIAKIEKQFDETAFTKTQKGLGKEAAAFDLLRAAVTLVVASILIAIGTSFKLPLSTTYVTFMVAMGTSLADGAWGRESAVYRITGVLSIIGGWFATALSAFTVAFVLAIIFYYGGMIAIAISIILALWVMYRSHLTHTKRVEDQEDMFDDVHEETTISKAKMMVKSSKNIVTVLEKIKKILSETLVGLSNENLKHLNSTYKNFLKVNKRTKKLKDNVAKTIAKLDDNSVEAGLYYVQVLDYLREITHSMFHITKPSLEHVDNNHKPIIKEQEAELAHITTSINTLLDRVIETVGKQDCSDVTSIVATQESILEGIVIARKKQVQRIKAHEVGTRNSMLYLNILAECKNLVLFTINLLKAQRDFNQYVNDDAIK